jgi:predicted dehydrogenase/threonine dehydrogenase-like Zn-dependent dehydrogenase
MKQVVEDLRNGHCTVVDVPCPQLRPGTVLVRNRYSLISSGTEGGTVKLGKMSWLGKARARPEQARKVLQVVQQQGVVTAFNVTMRALETPVVLGYSSAGHVLAVADDVTGISVGQLVACGGSGYANHAEVVCVPQNLVVVADAALTPRQACFATVGGIALQSIRVADVRLGESVAVIGLGLLGQLVAQLLKAAGCRVLGLDIDPRRIQQGVEQGYYSGALASDANVVEQALAFSGGYGLDAVIVTAATSDNQPVALAGEMLRRKGRTVVVGRTEMTAPRDTYLFKELELRTSMASGPGINDPVYELDGIDYPYGYVRWTENRNMQAFLEQVAMGRVQTESLVTHEYPVDESRQAFGLLAGGAAPFSTAILLGYPERDEAAVQSASVANPAAALVVPDAAATGYSVIGAGSFATNEFLPLIKRVMPGAPRVIVSATGVRAHSLAAKYGFSASASRNAEALDDAATGSVFVLTRHDSHAALAIAALTAGKHVFVEKPLALTEPDLAAVATAWRASGRVLMVGFNRRHAPLAVQLRERFRRRGQPMSVLYRANVGYRPPEHWMHDPVMGGGVMLGEACHHIDFCCWLVGAPVSDVSVRCVMGTGSGLLPPDNVHVSLAFSDGSLATVLYVSNGARSADAERVEVTCDNQLASLTDFARLSIHGRSGSQHKRLWLAADKGHVDELKAFTAAVNGQGSIDTEGMLHSSAVTLRVHELVQAYLAGR